MLTLTAHRLRFETTVTDTILLNEHKGASIRGALYHALRGDTGPPSWAGFCYNKFAPACEECPLSAGCPVSTLVATMNSDSERGAAVPRPYTIEPPLSEQTTYRPGERFDFGLTLFANALKLFPYIILAVERGMAPAGIGRRGEENGFRRGRFRVDAVWAENPLTGRDQLVLRQGDHMVHVPDVPITHRHIQAVSEALTAQGVSSVTMHFLTPTRITHEKHLLKQPAFRPILHRLLERIASLARDFTDQPLSEELIYHLVGLADGIEVVRDETRWVELISYSTRQRKATPTSGFVGPVTFAGDLALFLPWLIWGQFTHVGKDAVKGNGWYKLSAISEQPETDH